MNNWKKFASLPLMALALVALTPAGAQAEYSSDYNNNACCDPCNNSCNDCCSDWFIGIDLIYWKPCTDDLTFAATRPDSDNSHFKLHNVDPSWEPGFRIFVGREGACCQLDAKFSYTYLNVSDSCSAKENENTLPTNSHPGFWNPGSGGANFFDEAKGSWKSKYNEWDILFGADSCFSQCHKIRHYFGVAGICVDQRLTARLDNLDEGEAAGLLVTRWDNDLWGIGLRAGTEFKSNVCDCFNLIASGHVSVLAGDSCSKTRFDDRGRDSEEEGVTFEHIFKEDTNCQLLPGYHLALGFDYETNSCGCDMNIRFGYEFTAWHNFPTQRTYVQSDFNTSALNDPDAALSTNSNTRTYGFHGIFVGVGGSF